MTVLKEKLGEDGYAELMTLIQGDKADWKAWAKGAVKSWTVWFAGVLIGLPEIAPELLTQLQESLSPQNYAVAAQVIGFLVLMLRLKTTTSIAQKGKV